MHKIAKYIFNTKAYVLYAFALLVALAYDAFKGMSYLHFIDGLSVIGIIYLIIAVYIWAKNEKLLHFSFIKFLSGAYVKKRTDIDSVTDRYKEPENKTPEPNGFVGPGIIVTLIAAILTFFY